MGAQELAGAWPSVAARKNSCFEIWISQAPHRMSKQTGTLDHGAPGARVGSGYNASDGFSYRTLQCPTGDEILISQNGTTEPQKGPCCSLGSKGKTERSSGFMPTMYFGRHRAGGKRGSRYR
jgi:hypothetical protein